MLPTSRSSSASSALPNSSGSNSNLPERDRQTQRVAKRALETQEESWEPVSKMRINSKKIRNLLTDFTFDPSPKRTDALLDACNPEEMQCLALWIITNYLQGEYSELVAPQYNECFGNPWESNDPDYTGDCMHACMDLFDNPGFVWDPTPLLPTFRTLLAEVDFFLFPSEIFTFLFPLHSQPYNSELKDLIDKILKDRKQCEPDEENHFIAYLLRAIHAGCYDIGYKGDAGVARWLSEYQLLVGDDKYLECLGTLDSDLLYTPLRLLNEGRQETPSDLLGALVYRFRLTGEFDPNLLKAIAAADQLPAAMEMFGTLDPDVDALDLTPWSLPISQCSEKTLLALLRAYNGFFTKSEIFAFALTKRFVQLGLHPDKLGSTEKVWNLVKEYCMCHNGIFTPEEADELRRWLARLSPRDSMQFLIFEELTYFIDFPKFITALPPIAGELSKECVTFLQSLFLRWPTLCFPVHQVSYQHFSKLPYLGRMALFYYFPQQFPHTLPPDRYHFLLRRAMVLTRNPCLVSWDSWRVELTQICVAYKQNPNHFESFLKILIAYAKQHPTYSPEVETLILEIIRQSPPAQLGEGNYEPLKSYHFIILMAELCELTPSLFKDLDSNIFLEHFEAAAEGCNDSISKAEVLHALGILLKANPSSYTPEWLKPFLGSITELPFSLTDAPKALTAARAIEQVFKIPVPIKIGKNLSVALINRSLQGRLI